MTRRSTAVLASALALGCGGDAPTGLVLVIDAGADVEARAVALRLHVAGMSQGDTSYFDETRDAPEWPARVAIVPRGGDTTRTVRVDVEALDASAAPIAAAHVSTGFVAHETRVLHVTLDPACVACVPGACTAAACDGAFREPSALPTPACSAETCDAGPVGCAPRAEECNGSDDDCDGATDEALARECQGGHGCGGVQACVGGEWRGVCIDDRARPCGEES